MAGLVLAALALRVVVSYPLVFTGGGVSFQESDAWFHIRTIHNLLAHFPYRSGFDPYALYPGGQNIPTAPVWDYMVATVAWILALGAPSPSFIDGVAAWLPAILGALFCVPVFALARRLFGETAGLFAALWVAVGNGALLWIMHLGLADHHAAEGMFGFLTLVCLCSALEGRRHFGWVAGIAMGLFLATRPAGIFVPAILACLAVVAPAAAVPVLQAVVAAALVFLPATGNQWSEYTWLALAATGLVAAGVWGLDSLARRYQWSRALRLAVPLVAMVVGLALVVVARPQLWGSLWNEIRRVAGFAPGSNIVATVQELQPVYRSNYPPGWHSVFQALGTVWIVAMPVLLWLIAGFRRNRPALRLLTPWAVVTALAATMQVRMAIYFLPVAAVLAGAGCAWLVSRGATVRRLAVAGGLAVLILGVNLPWSMALMRSDSGIAPDWRMALGWLRQNTPEPIPDRAAWTARFARVAPGANPPVAGAWGVVAWWDFGYELELLAHRIPMTNGTQAGAEDVARFYTETIPQAAVSWLRRSGARYVVVDPLAPLFAGENNSRFPVQLQMLGRDMDSYVQVLWENTEHGRRPIPVYLPTYYQSMAARLYLGDGEAVAAAGGPWVFETLAVPEGKGNRAELIVSSKHFDTEAEAGVYLSEHRMQRLTYGCLDPGRSCLALPAVEGLKRVYSSDPLPISHKRIIKAVKIFQVLPE